MGNGEIWVGGHNYIGKIVSGANGTPGLRSYVSDVVSEGEALIGDIIGIETEGESMVYYTQDLRISIKGDSICSREPYVNNRFPIMISSVQAGPDIRVEADGGDGVKITDRRLGTSIRLTEDQGLCSNRVNKLVYDQHGSVWGATDNGLFQIDMPSFFSYYPFVAIRIHFMSAPRRDFLFMIPNPIILSLFLQRSGKPAGS